MDSHRAEGKKKNWPTEERISDGEKGSHFFFFIFHTRFIGRSDWSKGNICRGRIGVKLGRGNRYYTSVGKSWKSIEGEERDGKWSNAATAVVHARKCRIDPENVRVPSLLQSIYIPDPFANDFLSRKTGWTREDKERKKLDIYKWNVGNWTSWRRTSKFIKLIFLKFSAIRNQKSTLENSPFSSLLLILTRVSKFWRVKTNFNFENNSKFPTLQIFVTVLAFKTEKTKIKHRGSGDLKILKLRGLIWTVLHESRARNYSFE